MTAQGQNSEPAAGHADELPDMSVRERFQLRNLEILDRVMPGPVIACCALTVIVSESATTTGILALLYVAAQVGLDRLRTALVARGRSVLSVSEVRFWLSVLGCPAMYLSAGTSANAWYVAAPACVGMSLLFERLRLLRSLALALSMTVAAVLAGLRSEALLTLVVGLLSMVTLAVPYTKALHERSVQAADAADAARVAARAKAEFLATMSHEIRTPLNGMVGMIDLLAADELTEQQGEWLSHLRNSSLLLRHIVNDILDYSKIDAGKLNLLPQAFSPRALIERSLATVEVAAADKGLTIRGEARARVPAWLMGDDQRIEQVVLNLLTNAIKFTQAGTIEVTLDYADGALSIAVSDTGVGMTAEQQTRVFRAFEQADNSTSRQFGGTGLGLSICRRLSELMGGRIDVESEPGQGSRFVVVVPLSACDPPTVSQTASERPLVQRARILVAEDNRVNQIVIRNLLDKLGHDVVIVGDGLQAVRAAGEARFDLILMDCHMPELDGYAAAVRIRESEVEGADSNQVPIVALTADVSRGARERCRQAGMRDFLSKPIDRQELERVLARWLATRPPPTRLEGAPQ